MLTLRPGLSCACLVAWPVTADYASPCPLQRAGCLCISQGPGLLWVCSCGLARGGVRRCGVHRKDVVHLQCCVVSLCAGSQRFQLDQPLWVRYLLIQMLSHYGSEPMCAINGFAAYGAGRHSQVWFGLNATEHDSHIGSPNGPASVLRSPSDMRFWD